MSTEPHTHPHTHRRILYTWRLLCSHFCLHSFFAYQNIYKGKYSLGRYLYEWSFTLLFFVVRVELEPGKGGSLGKKQKVKKASSKGRPCMTKKIQSWPFTQSLTHFSRDPSNFFAEKYSGTSEIDMKSQTKWVSFDTYERRGKRGWKNV